MLILIATIIVSWFCGSTTVPLECGSVAVPQCHGSVTATALCGTVRGTAPASLRSMWYCGSHKERGTVSFYRLVTNMLNSSLPPIFSENFARVRSSACPMEMAGMGDCD